MRLLLLLGIMTGSASIPEKEEKYKRQKTPLRFLSFKMGLRAINR
jgi:hypothetical protein